MDELHSLRYINQNIKTMKSSSKQLTARAFCNTNVKSCAMIEDELMFNLSEQQHRGKNPDEMVYH